jgi:hypothetical protein
LRIMSLRRANGEASPLRPVGELLHRQGLCKKTVKP